ncbi:MAG: hypothetical protein ACTSXO_07295 [Candidatus Heimdallarchaeota archaeon]
MSSRSLLETSSFGGTDTINDFSGFLPYADSNLVTTILNKTMISMTYDNQPGNYEWETVYFGFGENKLYYDFNLLLELDYLYTGSLLKQFTFALGSFYFENRTFDEATPKGYLRLCAFDCWDAWDAHEGKYCISANPDNQGFDIIETTYGTLPSSASLQYIVTRINGILKLQIIKNGIIQIEHQWTTGVARPLNYLLIALAVDPSYCTFTNVKFTSLNVELKYWDIITRTITTTIFGLPGYIIGIIMSVSFGVMVITKKLREKA